MAPSASQRGFTLIELMVVMLIIGLLGALAVPMYEDALRESRQAALVNDCQQLYKALMVYYTDYSKFPSEDEFDKKTFAPLSTGGYFPGSKSLAGKLADGKAIVYIAFDVNGTDTQFILVARAAFDPNVIPVVASTDQIAAANGAIDGVYLIDRGELEEAEEDL